MFSGVERQSVRAGEALAQRVQRRGADVAVDDADRADDERGHRALCGLRRACGKGAERSAASDAVRRRVIVRRGARSGC